MRSVGKKLALLAVIAGAIVIIPSAPASAECTAAPSNGQVAADACVSWSGGNPGQPSAQVNASKGATKAYARTENDGYVTEVAGVCVGVTNALSYTDPLACANFGYQSGPTTTTHCLVRVFGPVALQSTCEQRPA